MSFRSFAVLSGALLIGCGLTGSSAPSGSGFCSDVGEFERPEPTETEAIGWQNISADRGGVVELAEGTTLEIPPGAMPCDATITVRIPRQPSSNDRVYLLEPVGMQFESPVTLHAPYEDLPSGTPLFSVYQSSADNPVIDAGSEQTNWTEPENVTVDEETHQVDVELEHFSFVWVFRHVDENAYLVLDIPYEYLQPGDALFTLTATDDANVEHDWAPGHVGMLTDVPGGNLAAAHMIESTPSRVRRVRATRIETDAGHLYLGARRPSRSRPLGEGDRIGAVSWLEQQIGKPYSLIGQGNTDEDTWSCVGLAEAAWDDVGRGVLYEWREVSIATPREMFNATSHVNEITVRAGEEIRIPIYGVVVDPDSPVIARRVRGWYTKNKAYTIEASNLPAGAEFVGSTEDGYEFRWTPTWDQACDTTPPNGPCPAGGEPYGIEVRLQAYPFGLLTPWVTDPVIINDILTIHVTGHSRQVTISAEPPGLDREYILQMMIPADAIVHGTWFRDEATDLYPSLEPFPGHTLTVLREGKFGPTTYGVHFRISNDGGGPSDVPDIHYRYNADYSLDYWRNDD